MIAALRDTPASNDKDLIGITNGMQSMRDHKQCFTTHKLRNGFLNVALVVDIDAGCGFVENDDRRIFENTARDGDALALAARKRRAAFANDGLKSIGNAVTKS